MSKNIRWWFVFPFAYFSAGVFAQGVGANPLSAETFFRDPDVVEALLSPTGRRLAVTTSKGGTRRALVVIDLAPGGKTARVAQFTDVDVANVVWVSDERLVFSLVDQTEGAVEASARAPGLFVVNADGSNARELISRKFVQVTNSSRKIVALDPNHRLLKVLAPKADAPNDEVLIGKLSGNYDGTPPNVYPLWLNVTTGRTRYTEFLPPDGPVGWLFDSKGEPRVVMTQDGTQRAAYWRGPGKREWKKIVEGDLLEMAFTPHSVDDLGNLFVSQQEGKEGFSVLKRFDFETMKPSVEPLISTPGFDFTGQLILERGTGAAQGLSVITDAETTLWFDETRKGIQTLVDKVLPGRVNRISCRQCNEPQAVVLVRSYSDQDPGKLFLYRPTPSEGQLQWQPVSAVRDGIDPRAMATVHFKRIKARDGRDLPVWITQPQGVEPGKPAPAIVMVHGGPQVRGGSWAWNPMNQFLASRGYVVIEPEFRGSKGYGDAHMKAGWKQWGQAMQDDVADALLWAQQQKLASDKACIAGASYGGYSTLMGLVRHPALYQCGIAWVAVTDLNLLVKGSWWVNDDTSALNRKHTIPEMVGDAQKDAAMLSANSPVLLASQIKSPLLLAFGEEDKRVPIAHGNRMREALQKAHVEPEWVTYPLEAHGWMMQKNKVDFANRMEAFLAKNLK